jgi:hypothetical protein
MSEKMLAPDVRRILSALERRVAILERRIAVSAAVDAVPNDDIIFSHTGPLSSGTESPPVKLRYSGILSILAVGLGTAGSTSTTLEVKRNGTVVATVVIAGGAADYGAHVGVRFDAEDRLTLRIATAGTGAANMTASARFT